MSSLSYYLGPDGRPCEIIVPHDAERISGFRYWPGHGLLCGDKVYLFYVGIQHKDVKNTWGFEVAGSGLAVFDPATGKSRRIWTDGHWALWNSAISRAHWGVQVLREGDTVYVYGSHRRGWDQRALLAKVPFHEIDKPEAYRFLTSGEPVWSERASEAVEVTSCDGEFSVSYNQYLKRYVMTYVDGYEKILCIRTADHPWGPFSERQSLGGLPHREQSEVLSLGFEHPHFATNTGKTIVVTYCEPRFTQNSLVTITFA